MTDSRLDFSDNKLNCENLPNQEPYLDRISIFSTKAIEKEKPEQVNIWGYRSCPTPVYFTNKKSHKIIKRGCGSWDCPVCAKKKSSKIQRKAIQAGQKQAGFIRFLTLTVKSDENIMGDWNNLLTQLRKQKYIDSFFWVKEFQERGERHLHIIFWGKFIPWQNIKKYWDGNIKINKGRGSPLRYIVKYLGDSEKQELFNKGERRYSASDGFFEHLEKKTPTYEWELVGSWSEEYKDVAFAYDQQNNDIEIYKSKFECKDYNPEFQKRIGGE